MSVKMKPTSFLFIHRRNGYFNYVRPANLIFAFYFLITLINVSCKHPANNQQAKINVLLGNAGSNEGELKKVLDYYQRPRDSLKLKAAYFLLANLNDQYHYEGDGVKAYHKTFEKMDSIVKSGHGIFDRTWDSLQKIYPPPMQYSISRVPDYSTITSEFLIKNIEDSFKAWQYPWARSLNFNDFCKYILPYKLGNEQPEYWKERIQKEYAWLLDSLKGVKDPRKVCLMVNKQLKQFFYINAKVDCPWDMNYSELLKTHTGKCSDATRFAAYVMRSLGIPIVLDFTPNWANKDVGHQWNALIFNKKPLYFTGTESDIGQYKIVFTRSYWIRRKPGKVYRITYENNESALINQVKDEDVPFFFKDPHLLDVTNSYMPTHNATVYLNRAVSDKRWAYLCIFNEHLWKPIAWAKIGFFNRTTFNALETGIVYLPAYYKDNGLIPAGPPFILGKDGDIIKLQPDNNHLRNIKLYQKYPEEKSNNIFPNMNYELFYWDNDNGWLSAGKQHSLKNYLIYRNMPNNTLFWLRNLDKGKQERIFTYENNKQVWW